MASHLIPLVLLLAAGKAPSPMPVVAPAGLPLDGDGQLQGFVAEAMSLRPELAQARAQIRAERERVPQSRALPDPTLTLGIQNDGFGSLQIGKMETSFLAVTASQTFPWAGKRRLRAEVADFAATAAEVDLRRTELTVRADVERAYLDLLLVREQMQILSRLEGLWSQSETLARVRYEAGEGAQSDLLRAQLERQRLRQQRWSLESEERRRVFVLNRLRGRPADEAIVTTRELTDVPDPAVPDPRQAVTNAEAESPELRKATLAGQQAGRTVDLAKRERWPDVTVSAGLMPRWGNFETMWQASVGLNLPIWTSQKQGRAIAESQARAEAATSGADAIRQLLRQRVQERVAALGAAVQSNQLYRSGLLVQSEATVSSSLAQYQVGRTSFASVLEALAGYLGDRNGFLDSIASAQRIAIAEREISLDVVGASSGGGMKTASVPGAGVAAGSSASPAPAGAPRPAEASGSGSMSRM